MMIPLTNKQIAHSSEYTETPFGAFGSPSRPTCQPPGHSSPALVLSIQWILPYSSTLPSHPSTQWPAHCPLHCPPFSAPQVSLSEDGQKP